MTCYNLSAFIRGYFFLNPLQDLLFCLNAVISNNFSVIVADRQKEMTADKDLKACVGVTVFAGVD